MEMRTPSRKRAHHPDCARQASGRRNGASYSLANHLQGEKGDTVQTVADNFSVPPTMVRRWNHLRGTAYGAGVCLLHLPVTPSALSGEPCLRPSPNPIGTYSPSASKAVEHHKVQPGETFSSIASTHNMTVDDLKEITATWPCCGRDGFGYQQLRSDSPHNLRFKTDFPAPLTETPV